MFKRMIDITGKKFGRLTALEPYAKARDNSLIWTCLCDCGNTHLARSQDLRRGATTQCSNCRNIKHGHASADKTKRHPLYETWHGMWQRCTNKNARSYKRYGGRGITVCARWKDFQAFIDDMGERPPKTTLDRIDPDGNYEPKNCRWATADIQRSNKSKL